MPLGLLGSCHIPVWAEKICTPGMFRICFKSRGATAASSTDTESLLGAEAWRSVSGRWHGVHWAVLSAAVWKHIQ